MPTPYAGARTGVPLADRRRQPRLYNFGPMSDISIVAVDWSGRVSGAAESIWVACTDADGQLIGLENGRGREALVDHLVAFAAGTRLVVGLDFAFGFPAWWSTQQGWTSGKEIWQAMRDRGEALLASCEPPFWGRAGRPRPDVEGLRRTDLATRPAKSVFQIGGAGAVGTASVRGMAQLARLSAAGFAVWPFDDDGARPVVVEIYPRRLTGPVNKSSWRARHEYLANRHPEQPIRMLERAAGSEDAFDAAVSAIAMRRRWGRLPAITDTTLRLEGLIWTPPA
jgi:hypothetical protein